MKRCMFRGVSSVNRYYVNGQFNVWSWRKEGCYNETERFEQSSVKPVTVALK
jgi:hypothetical protein